MTTETLKTLKVTFQVPDDDLTSEKTHEYSELLLNAVAYFQITNNLSDRENELINNLLHES